MYSYYLSVTIKKKTCCMQHAFNILLFLFFVLGVLSARITKLLELDFALN